MENKLYNLTLIRMIKFNNSVFYMVIVNNSVFYMVIVNNSVIYMVIVNNLVFYMVIVNNLVFYMVIECFEYVDFEFLVELLLFGTVSSKNTLLGSFLIFHELQRTSITFIQNSSIKLFLHIQNWTIHHKVIRHWIYH